MKVRYSMNAAPHGHPQLIMKKLGIPYYDCEPCPIGDCWFFWLPDDFDGELPNFIEKI